MKFLLSNCFHGLRHPDSSDESEPSWLEPKLKLKDFQLGSAQLVTFSTSARNWKFAEKQAEIQLLKHLLC